jgi:hypothetical protein
MTKRSILLMLISAMLAGCGQVIVFGHVVGERAASSEVKPSAAGTPPATSSAVRGVKAVSLSLSPAAASEVAGDSRFTTGALLDAIKAELASRGLLDEQNPRADGTAEILIDHLATRPTVNAVIFGRQMMAGTLTGGIRVTGPNGDELPDFRIAAESRLSFAVNGDDENPLGPLYRRFAELAADRLAGVQSKPVNISADGMPRS